MGEGKETIMYCYEVFILDEPVDIIWADTKEEAQELAIKVHGARATVTFRA